MPSKRKIPLNRLVFETQYAISHMSTITTVTWGIFFSLLVLNAGLLLNKDKIKEDWIFVVLVVFFLDCLMILIYQREHWSRKANRLRMEKVRTALENKSGTGKELLVEEFGKGLGYGLYAVLHSSLLLSPLYVAWHFPKSSASILSQNVIIQNFTLRPLFFSMVLGAAVFFLICEFMEYKYDQKMRA